MRALIGLLVLGAACGRHGFDPVTGDGGADGNQDADAGLGELSQQVYLKGSVLASYDEFGYAIALAGDTLVVGARFGDELQPSTGAVFVFVRSGDTWTEQARLTASNGLADDRFGSSVAISGETIAVSARFEDGAAIDSGAAYVFTRSGTTWTEQAYLKASTPQAGAELGYAIALAGDTLVVGAHLEDGIAADAGAAYVFTRTGTTWAEQARLVAADAQPNDQLGRAVAIEADTVAVGAWLHDDGGTNTGAVYVYRRAGAAWTEEAYLTAAVAGANDQFGFPLALSGDSLAVGAWDEASAAVGVGGDALDDTAPSSGAAYVFTRAGTAWSQQAYLKATNTGAGDHFGLDIAIDGDALVVGAIGEASAATGVDGDPASDAAPGSGAAYVYTRAGGLWTPTAYLKASNTGADDQFGYSVAISGGTIAVGAIYEDSNGIGVGAEQGNDLALNSGAVYLFR